MGRDRTSRHRTDSEAAGTLLLLVAALAFSTAGVFTRMAPVTLWSMVVWRNGFGCLGLAALLISGRQDDRFGLKPLGVIGWAAMVLSAFATVCYLAAFAHTSVANISIIYATAPMIGAALSWLCLGERPAPRTLKAAALALTGVAITVGGSLSGGTIAGDGLALLMTVALSGVAVLARARALPPLATAFGSSGLAACAVLPASVLAPEGLQVRLHDGLWLAAFGLVTMTLALPAYLAGANRVPAGRAMLISSIELPLAPLWVWLLCGELPPLTSALGGGLILAAVVFDARHSRL